MTFRNIITRKTNRLVNRKFTPLWLFVSGAALEACGSSSSSGGGDVTEIVIAIPNVQDNSKNGPEGVTPSDVLFTPVLTDSSVDGVTFEIKSQTDINGRIVDIFEINSRGEVIIAPGVVFDYENPEGISETDFLSLTPAERDNANTYKINVVAKVGELTSDPVIYTFVITDEPDAAVLSTMSNVKPTGTVSVSPPSADNTNDIEIPITDFLKAFDDQDTHSANQINQLSFSVIPTGVTLQYKAADGTLSLIETGMAFGIKADGAIVATIDESVPIGEVVLAYSGFEGEIEISGSASLTFSVNNAPNIGSVTDAANEVVTDGAIEILENTADDIAIFKIAVSDIDAGQALSYSLEGADAGLFDVNPDGTDANIALITFRSAVGDDGAFSPDFETPGSSDDDNIYSITFVVIDALDASDNLDLEVTILDQDEAATDIMLSSEAIVEDETATQVGSQDVYLVGEISFTDPDGINFAVNTPSLNTDSEADFVIDDNKLYLKHKPDFETKSSYSVTIIANAGTATVYETAAITITVGDVDEAPTLSDSVSLGDVKKGDADTDGEDLTISQLLIDAGYSDQDVDDYISKIEITSISAVVSNTDSTAVVIAVGDLTLTYTDVDVSTGTPTLGTPVDFSIDIPIDPSDDIVDGSINIKIADGVADGTLYTVKYKVYDSEDTDTSNLALASNEASLTFTATSVAINFDDNIIVSVPENSAADTLVATVSATVPENSGYTISSYSLDSNIFSIDASTGVITLTGELDFEDVAQYSLGVIATASDTGGLLPDVTSTTDVVLDVTDVEELAVVTVDDASGTNVDITNSVASVSVAENTLAVATLSGSDIDGTTTAGGATQSVKFRALATDSPFQITEDGVLSFTSAPDFETPRDADTDNVYSVTVTAYSVYDSDGTTQVLDSEVQTTVNVQVLDDVSDNDALAVVDVTLASGVSEPSTPNDPYRIDEGSNTDIGIFSGSDADSDQEVRFEIKAGDDATLFTVTEDGVLSFTSAPDFETLPTPANGNALKTYSVTVNAYSVDDEGEKIPNSDVPTTLRVQVGDVDEDFGDVTVRNSANNVVNITNSVGSVSVTENTFIAAIFSAIDPDETDTVKFVIDDTDVNGDYKLFKINFVDTTFEANNYWELRFIRPPDFETPGSSASSNDYSVTVTAYSYSTGDDGTGNEIGRIAGSEVDTIVNIQVTDDGFDVEAIVFEPIAYISLNENSDTGTSVATIQASSSVAGYTVYYSLVGAGSDLFAVDAVTGEITLTGAVYYEEAAQHYLSIVAAASINAGVTYDYYSSTLVTVNIIDVDDKPTKIEIVADNNIPITTIEENLAAEANQIDGNDVYLVGKITADDPDDASTDNPGYSENTLSLAADELDGGSFVIDDNKLYLKHKPNYETKSSYSVKIIANAGTATEVSSTIEITVSNVEEIAIVTVDDASGADVDITNSAVSVSVAENIRAVATLSGSDEDVNQEVRFEIKAGDDATLFKIDATTGVLSFKADAAPDFEAVNTQGEYLVTINARSVYVNDKQSVAGGNVAINVAVQLNDADEAPTITVVDDNHALVTSIEENSITSVVFDPNNDGISDELYLVGEITFTDPDGADSGFTGNTLSLGGDDADKFYLDTTTNKLYLTESPNFETQSSYSVDIIATSVNNKIHLPVTFDITITDVNEAPILSNFVSGGITITDGTEPPALPSSVSIGDIKKGDTAEDGETLTIWDIRQIINEAGYSDEDAGDDLNNISKIEITSISSDATDNTAALAALTLTYTDSIGATINGSTFDSTTPVAFGTDGTLDGSINIKIADDVTDGTVYTVKYKVYDSEGLASAEEGILTFTATSVAISFPGLSLLLLDENHEVDTEFYSEAVISIPAGYTVSYSLSETSDIFKIAEDSGTLSLTKELDYETDPTTQYFIRAKATFSDGNTALTTYATVVINVTDVDEAPTITVGVNGDTITSSYQQGNQIISIVENSITSVVFDPNNDGISDELYLVGEITVTDPDVNPAFTRNTLSLGGDDADKFYLDTTTNKLYLKYKPNYEIKSSYYVEIIANAGTATVYETAAITITVGDVNEALTDITLSSEAIEENKEADQIDGNDVYFVGEITVTDPDDASPDNPEYFANPLTLGGTNASSFVIADNKLYLKHSPNYETKSSYSVTIIANDLVPETRYETDAITINVRDVDETPTIITLANNEIEENVVAEADLIDGQDVYFVGTLSIIDPDNASPDNPDFSANNALTLGGDDADKFYIHTTTDAGTTTNKLYLKESPDYETKSSYSVTIVATTRSFGKIINVKNVDDLAVVTVFAVATYVVAPDPSTPSEPYQIAEGSNTYIATFSGTDEDTGQSVKFRALDASSPFQIIEGTGVEVGQWFFSFKEAPDFEDVNAPTDNIYSVTVTAYSVGADGDRITDSEVDTIVKVQITDDTADVDVPNTGFIDLGAISVDENTSNDLNNVITTVSLKADSIPTDYSFAGGDVSSELFEIDSVTGVITLRSELDYEEATQYYLGVRATLDTITYSSIITVNVNDVDEAPTKIEIIDNNDTPGISIEENVAAADDQIDGQNVYLVGAITVTDPDVNPAFTNTLTLGGTNASSFVIADNKLYLPESPDYETKSSYSITIIANAGTATVYETAAITITVGDIAEPSVITLADASEQAVNIDENSEVEVSVAENTLDVATFTGEDPDKFEEVRFHIDNNVGDDNLFQITEDGVLTFKADAAPDFENPADTNKDNKYSITIIAESYHLTLDAIPESERTIILTVEVIDADDPNVDEAPVVTVYEANNNTPITDIATAEPKEIAENNSPTLYKFSGDDIDAGREVKFRVETNSPFKILEDPNNAGQWLLSFKEAPDFEDVDAPADNIYSVTVTAYSVDTSGAEDTLTTSTIVNIKVTNTNDINVDDPAVVTVFAADDITVIDDPINNPAEINEGDMGTIYIFSGEDIDMHETVKFKINYTDSPFEVTENGALTFKNDNIPDYENPLDADGNNIYSVTVTAYSVGADGITKVPDSEEIDTIVNVRVTNVDDSGTDDPADITVYNHLGTVIEAPVANPARIAENVSDQILYIFSGEDVDVDETVEFRIDNTDNLFELVEDDGQWLLSFDGSAPDYESPGVLNDNLYSVSITAYSVGADGITQVPGSEEIRTTVNVQVTDVDEYSADPEFIPNTDIASTGTLGVFGIPYQIAEGNTEIGTFSGSDADGSQEVGFEIKAGDDATLFTVTEDGVLSFTSAPDFETPLDTGADNVYSVTVTAYSYSDHIGVDGSEIGRIDGSDIPITVNIKVSDVDDPNFDDSAVVTVYNHLGTLIEDPINNPAEIAENVDDQTLYIFSGDDIDVDETVKFRELDTSSLFQLIEDPNNAGQWKLSFKVAPNFEDVDAPADNIYSVTVTAYSVGADDIQVLDSEEVPITVRVRVIDVDEGSAFQHGSQIETSELEIDAYEGLSLDEEDTPYFAPIDSFGE